MKRRRQKREWSRNIGEDENKGKFKIFRGNLENNEAQIKLECIFCSDERKNGRSELEQTQMTTCVH